MTELEASGLRMDYLRLKRVTYADYLCSYIEHMHMYSCMYIYARVCMYIQGKFYTNK